MGGGRGHENAMAVAIVKTVCSLYSLQVVIFIPPVQVKLGLVIKTFQKTGDG